MLLFRVRGDLGAMAMKRCSAFPKLQHYWSLTIRLFSVISGHSLGRGGVLPFCRGAVGVFYSPSWLGKQLELVWSYDIHIAKYKKITKLLTHSNNNNNNSEIPMDCGSKTRVKLATVVEGDPKAPFSIATTPSCRGGHYSFPWIAPLYPWYVPYNAEF